MFAFRLMTPHLWFGQGRQTWQDGRAYEGSFKQGRPNGFVVFLGDEGCGKINYRMTWAHPNSSAIYIFQFIYSTRIVGLFFVAGW